MLIPLVGACRGCHICVHCWWYLQSQGSICRRGVNPGTGFHNPGSTLNIRTPPESDFNLGIGCFCITTSLHKPRWINVFFSKFNFIQRIFTVALSFFGFFPPGFMELSCENRPIYVLITMWSYRVLHNKCVRRESWCHCTTVNLQKIKRSGVKHQRRHRPSDRHRYVFVGHVIEHTNQVWPNTLRITVDIYKFNFLILLGLGPTTNASR